MDKPSNPNQHFEGQLPPAVDTLTENQDNALDMPNIDAIEKNIDALTPVEVPVNPLEILKTENVAEQSGGQVDQKDQTQQNVSISETDRIPVPQTINPAVNIPIKVAKPLSSIHAENYIDQVFNANGKDLDPARLTDQLNNLQEIISSK